MRLIGENGWELRTKRGAPVKLAQRVKSFRGEIAFVTGGRPPHKPGSEGKVYVCENADAAAAEMYPAEYYPSVYGLKWVRL